MTFKDRIGYNEIFKLNLWKAVLGEVVVTILYIIIVCGAGLNILKSHPPTLLHISITTGFTVAILASAFWEVSGGHFNPAVSIALAIRNQISWIRCVLYVIAQCAGSALGAVILKACTPKKFQGTLGALSLNAEISPGVGFVLEVILTYVLIWTVIASTDPIKNFTGFQAPFAIGMSVMIGLLMGIPYTGASLNPIRAFGPAVIMNKREHHWIYWAGPILGCILAALTYDYVFKLSTNKEVELKNGSNSVKKLVSEKPYGSIRESTFSVESTN